MRVDVRDGGLATDGRPHWAHRAYLDDVEMPSTIMADEEAGEILLFEMQEGHESTPMDPRFIRVVDGEPLTRVLRGRVRIDPS